jgi:pimeloyl-ACP methyl ester carboxylesterase
MRRVVVVSGLLVVALSGCAHRTPARASLDPAPDASPAYVLHLPGIGGFMGIDRSMLRGLKEGGFENAEVEVYDWTHEDRGMTALVSYDRNKEEARRIAGRIEQHFRADSRTKIYLIGHSGGAGLAVWALEDLPDDVRVESLMLLSPALSPDYDLSPALKHVRGKAHVFTSPLDGVVLGAGTRVFGTIDRVRTDAAGRIGFARPKHPADATQYEKLVAWPYDAAWMEYGNIGDHIGPMTRSFARKVLAPVLLTGQPSADERRHVEEARQATTRGDS